MVSIGLLLPTAALAQVDPNVTASCKDARDFYGCVMAFKTPSQSKADRAPVEAVMGQVAASLIAGPMVQNAPANFARSDTPIRLAEAILRGVLR